MELFFLTAILFALNCPGTLFAQVDDADDDPAETIVIYDSNHNYATFENSKDQTTEKTDASSPSVAVLSIDGEDASSDAFDVEEALSPVDPIEESSENTLDAQEAGDEPVSSEKKSEPLYDVLIDKRHAHDFSEFPLTLDDHFYHRIYSFHRAFSYLRSQGLVVQTYDAEEPLDESTLSSYKTLFLNLPSADKEPFLISEIFAIKKFIERGGSLFLIVDHTNCYFHQSRLQPLLHELDVETQHYGVCDATQNLGDGFGWVYFNEFFTCPVTQNLRQIAFQTGGGVDPRNAVAWSSKDSWQDAAGMPIYGEAELAYYGNFTRDKNEPIGPSGVVLAKEIGKGKLVMIGDQNLFSAFFLQYLDNYRLWINSFAWLLDRPEISEPERYVAEANKGSVFLCWEELTKEALRFGSPDQTGYYNVYTYLCRYYNPFCVAHDDSKIGLAPELLVWIKGDQTISSEGLELACSHLEQGKTLLALDAEINVFHDPNAGLVRLLKKLETLGVTNDAPWNVSPVDPKTAKKSRETIQLSNGGKIIVLRGQNSFSNQNIPTPESSLSFIQQANLKTLLNTIDSILKPQVVPQEKGSPLSVPIKVRAPK